MSEPLTPEPQPAEASAPGHYRVRLEVFEGPLDLLLHLIRKNELDIFNIPLSIITEQYLGYVGLMKELDLEVAGEFIVMAATLVHIKTRLLLPRPPDEQVAGDAEDPRQELVQRLIEHQRYKAAATALYQREIIQDQMWTRTAPLAKPGVEDDGMVEVGLFDLLATLKDIIERARGRIVIEVEPERFSVADRIQHITEVMDVSGSVAFDQLFDDARSRREIVVTFLALLEMIRLRMIRVLQKSAFGTIWLFRRDGDASAGGGDAPAATAEATLSEEG